MNLLILTSLVILLSIFYIWAKFKLSYWQRRGVPTLPTNILFGNFKDSFFLRISPGFLLGRLYNEVTSNEPFLGIYILHKPFLLLRDPEIIKQVLIKDFNIFSNRYFAARRDGDRLGTDNLFSIKNPEWRYLRTKLSPAFTTGKIKQLFPLMVETSDFLKNYLDKKFEDDPKKIVPIEVRNTTTMYTTDIISTVAFGVSTNSFAEPTPEFYLRSRMPSEMTLLRTLSMFSIFFFPSLSKLFGSFSFFGKHTEYFRNVFWSSMNAREEAKVERGDVIDSLLKLKNEKQESNFKLEGDTLVAQSAIFFVAGLESSAVTMAFALWELAKAPEIQKRAREEIRNCIKTNLTYDSILELKYLMQIINETMRLYPPAPIIDRVANEDYKIPRSNVVIEKGTPVYVPLPGIHMDPRYHPNPEKFDPDRFSDENKNEIQPCTYMPFGEGPRICIAFRVGTLQTAVGLVRILQDYEVSVNPEYKASISPRNVFTTPENGVHLFFKKLDV